MRGGCEMNKLELAHDWYMKHSESPSFMNTEVEQAWQYADAMQAEADKRIDKSLPDVLTGDDIDRVVRAFKPLK